MKQIEELDEVAKKYRFIVIDEAHDLVLFDDLWIQ